MCANEGVHKKNLALRWRADGTEPTNTSITLMAAHSIYIGKSVEVRSGSRPLRGLENRRPKGYAGSSPVPSAITHQLKYFHKSPYHHSSSDKRTSVSGTSRAENRKLC
jgi:hypothetical protein